MSFSSIKNGNNLKISRLIQLIFITLGWELSYAQRPPQVNYVGVDQGLSNNSVTGIFQDKQGFMWFGTYDGLNKFDGDLVQVFRNRISDSTSLPYNYIYSIDEDGQRNIWAGTGQGIGVYNRASGKFSSAYYMTDNGEQLKKLDGPIQVVKNDGSGNILVGSNYQGLFYKKRSGANLIRIPYKDRRGKLIYDLHIAAIALGKNNQVWIVGGGVGICTLTHNAKAFVTVANDLKDIACILYHDDKLWLGTRTGVFVYEFNSGKMKLVQSPILNRYKGKSITSLLIDRQEIWVGIEGEGLNIVNLKNGNEERLTNAQSDVFNLSSDASISLFLDKDHRKWIGSRKGGVAFVDSFKNPFQSVRHQAHYPNSLVDNAVSCFAEMNAESLWIGTDGGGVSLWNRRLNTFTNYTHQAGKSTSLSSNHITSICKDYRGNVWISTYGGGINRYNNNKGTFTHYICTDSSGVANNYPLLFLENRKKNLLVSTFFGGGVYKYHEARDNFEILDQRLTNTISMIEDSNGMLWGGDSRFLAQVEQSSQRLKDYDIGKPIRDIYEDNDKKIWLGTEGGGLLLFDRNLGKVTARFSDTEGLSNNAVLNILEDNSGCLWLSTFDGLSRFDKKAKTFQNYYKHDGLSSNQFYYNSALKLKTGEMVFGGTDGFTIFHPDSLANVTIPSSLPYLASVTLNPSLPTLSEDYLSYRQDGVSSLRLPFEETSFSLVISSIDYTSSGDQNFIYFLEGWDKSWSPARSSTMINYTHLDKGSYRLHARTRNSIGILGPDTVLLELTVLPPWYATVWAYVIYLSILGLLIYKYNSYRVDKADTKLKDILSVQHAQNEKEIAERKLKFFTEVSHEFRTPLTLIINPLREYLKRNYNTPQINDLQRVHTNAQRLLGLVDQLLLFRKVGANLDDLRVVKLAFDTTCRNVFNSFKDQAKLKNIKYQLQIKTEPITLNADKEKMEVILYNLLSNAIKFTPKGGEVKMIVMEESNQINLMIVDSGPGIPQEVGDKLFEQFYQVRGTKAVAGNGFGIGLYLVKHFVDRHYGTICYQSSVGQGTTFQLSFLKGDKHLSDYTIHQDIDVFPTLPVLAKPEKTGLDKMLSRQKRVLVVEDNDELLDFLTGILQEIYIIYKSSSGNAAFESAKQNLPDVIITDIMMEDGNGLELCRKVKSDPVLGHIPVILLTAVSDSEIKLSAVESGADDYIVKPFEADLLLARIKTLLENRGKLQAYFYNEITLKKHDFDIPSEYAQFLDKCIKIIDANIGDAGFNIKKLSSEIGMSHSAIYRKVKVISGESIASFIRHIRLRKAAELMITTRYSISEIAFQVGIGDQKYFRTKFNGLFGINPSNYIKKYRPASQTKL